MTAPIGWYVHHHGRGHLNRAAEVIPRMQREVTILTSHPAVDPEGPWQSTVQLPLDIGTSKASAPALRRLHHAPLHVDGLRERVALVAAWFEERRPALLVVDVSAEVTLLSRIAGVPPVVVAMRGRRTDAAHLTALDAALARVAPYPEFLEDESTPAWVRARTHYVGGFSRFDGRGLSREDARRALRLPPGDRVVVVVAGTGGSDLRPSDVAAAAAATTGWSWIAIGMAEGDGFRSVGWTEDPFPYLRAADVVVAGTGSSVIMEVASARRPLITIPGRRPFGEQRATARRLREHQLAIVEDRWPDLKRWPELLEAAAASDLSRLAVLCDGSGADRAAGYLDGLAEQLSP